MTQLRIRHALGEHVEVSWGGVPLDEPRKLGMGGRPATLEVTA